MVIRNQSYKIVSSNAQVSRTNIKASQNHFEKNDKYMDYALWVKDLHHSFKKKCLYYTHGRFKNCKILARLK